MKEEEESHAKVGRAGEKVQLLSSGLEAKQLFDVVQKGGGLHQEIVEIDIAGRGVARHIQHIVRLIDHDRRVIELDAHRVTDGRIDDVVVWTEDDLRLLHHLPCHKLPLNKHDTNNVRTHPISQAYLLQILDVEHPLQLPRHALDRL